MQRILIVDDEKHIRDGLAMALGSRYAVTTASDGGEALQLLRTQLFDLVLTDLRMTGASGMEVIEFAQSLPYPPKCILLTAYGDIATAVQAMKLGASDFLPKPIDLDVLDARVDQLLTSSDTKTSTKSEVKLIGRSPAFLRAMTMVQKVAQSNANVLLLGETGVGKELFAREIHRLSTRSAGAFVPVNGAAIPHDMVESELFGYERGAFTDARRQHVGYLERATDGTLFLDEVGELPADVQVKLLRVLETHTFERLGGSENLTSDFRLISATHRDLTSLIRSGVFREDLFYRIGVVTIAIPPLRERQEDIPLLLDFYWSPLGKSAPHLTPRALAVLKSYPWPGNIRELKNFCESAAILHPDETLDVADLDGRFSGAFSAGEVQPQKFSIAEPITPEGVRVAVEQHNGNKSAAATALGISRSTLYRILKEDQSHSW